MLVLFLLITTLVFASMYDNERQKNKSKSNDSAQSLDDYRRGYSDGERAVTRQLAEDIESGKQIDSDYVGALGTRSTAQSTTELNIITQSSDEPAATVALMHEQPTVNTAATQAERDTRNINTILYVASFMIVGAAVLFIGAALPPIAKFIGLIVVMMVFYLIGLEVYRVSKRLQPAATAFVGTGLAIVPFVGLAFYNFVVDNGQLAWWLTSVLGLVLYFGALIRIRSEVIGYLSLGFVYSFAVSSVSLLSVPFVWYFVALIVVSSVLTWISARRDDSVALPLVRPIQHTGELGVLVALVGSLFLVGTLSTLDYAIITTVATIHYAIAALSTTDMRSLRVSVILARVLGILSVLLASYALSDSYVVVGYALAILAVLTTVYSIRHHDETDEQAWLAASQGMLVLSCLLWVGEWPLVAYGLVTLGVISLWQAFVARLEWSSVGFVIAMLCVPATLLGGVWRVDAIYEWLAAIATCGAVIWLVTRAVYLRGYWRQTAIASYLLLSVQALAMAIMVFDAAWVGTVFAVVAVVAFVSSFVEKQPYVAVAANVLSIVAIANFVSLIDIDAQWQLMLTAWLSGALWYGLRWWYVSRRDDMRRDIMSVSTLIVLLVVGLIGLFVLDSTVVAAALTVLVAAGMLVYEGYERRMVSAYELAVPIVTVALQRLVYEAYPDANVLVYTHWWAAAIGLQAYIRHRFGRSADGVRARAIIALTAVSVPTGIAAIASGGMYQVVFLIEHVLMLLVGFAMGKRLGLLWGAIGIGIALLWMLRGYTFILLALLGIGLIVLAVVKLLKSDVQDLRK